MKKIIIVIVWAIPVLILSTGFFIWFGLQGSWRYAKEIVTKFYNKIDNE